MAAPREHLAVVLPEYARAILAGRKRVELRASVTRRAPFGVVCAGDRVHFKCRGGEVAASARVAMVEEFSGLTPRVVRELSRRYRAVGGRGSERYWRTKSGARFATVIWLRDVCAADRPPRAPRLYGDAWVVLDRRRRAAKSG